MCSYTISVAHTFRNTLATFNFIIVGYNTRIPTLIVKFWITKQFDKSGFDEVIQLLELLLAIEQNGGYSIKKICNFCLLFFTWNRDIHISYHLTV